DATGTVWTASQIYANFAHPALVYNPDSINQQPIAEVTFTGSSSITSIQVQLTWNNGTPQSWVNYPVATGIQTVSVGDPVNVVITTPGIYVWKLVVQATLSGGGTVTNTYTGKALIWCTNNSPFGPGWTLAGMEHLYDGGGAGIMITRGSS